MSTEILDDLLTVRELSKWLRLSESHIYSLVSKKKIPYNKVGGNMQRKDGFRKDVKAWSFKYANDTN